MKNNNKPSLWVRVIGGILLRFARTKVQVVATSPYYPANATVYLSLFRQQYKEVDHMKVPMYDSGYVNVEYILQKIPNIVSLEVKYSDGYAEQVEKYIED